MRKSRVKTDKPSIRGIDSWMSHLIHLQNRVMYLKTCAVCRLRAGNQEQLVLPQEIRSNADVFTKLQKLSLNRMDYK